CGAARPVHRSWPMARSSESGPGAPEAVSFASINSSSFEGPRLLIPFEGEYPAFIRLPWRPRQQHIRSASAAKRCVRTALVVVPPPGFYRGSGEFERREPVRVQALVAQATVEALDERIVRRLTGPVEIQRDPVLVSPSVERLRDKLRAIVYPDS